MALEDDLMRVNELLDRNIDALGGAFDGEMERVLARWVRAVSAAVGDLPAKGGVLQPAAARQSGTFAAAARSALEAAGFRRTVERHIADIPTVVKGVQRSLTLVGVPRMKVQEADQLPIMMKAYFQLKVGEFDRAATAIIDRLRDVVSKGAMARQDAGEVAYEVREVAEELRRQAHTLFDTAMSELAQLTTALRALTPEHVFLYTGPVDLRIRPFCLQHVGKVWTRQHIDKADNRQQPNTFMTRGGYNCRHQWTPVSDVPRLAALADTGRYANKGIEGRVASVRAMQKTGVRSKRSA